MSLLNLHPSRTTGQRALLWLIFGVAIALRISLSLVNLEANDQHFQVIDFIRSHGTLPTRTDCWECSQPKLFHLSIAALLDVLPVESRTSQIRVAELVNCMAGIVTIVVAYLFLWQTSLTTRTKLISFSMIALNPRLIGINAQATNDSFVILFSTLALFHAHRFFRQRRQRNFWFMTAAAILAALSKGNGLVLFPAIVALFVIRFLATRGMSPDLRKGLVPYLALFVLAFVGVVAPAGQYAQNYRLYGTPFVTNIDPVPMPMWFEKTTAYRPGVTSIADSYFTFRIFDLIRQPMIANDPKSYAAHRTSLWSQLYGRANFVHFVRWPPSWRTHSPIVINIGRALMVVALVPMLFFVVGAISRARIWLRALVRHEWGFVAGGGGWVLDVGLLAYLGFIVMYTMRYRDYSCMKAVFIFPALLCFAHVFARGASTIYRRAERWRLTRLCDAAFIALAALYCADVASLILQIYSP